MRLLGVFGAFSLITAAACGGGGGGDGNGGPGPTPQQTLDRIQPNVTSLSLTAGQSGTITVTAIDTRGGTIANPGAPIFTTRSPAIAEVNSQGSVIGITAGSTTIDISLTHGTVTRTASVAVTVAGSLPNTASVAAGTATNTFQPQTVAVARNATVTWSFGSVLHNVTFASTTGAPANIPNTENASVSRTFTAAGNFNYDCTIHAGMTGTVIVR